MSYMQAMAVGWAIFWRQAVWILAAICSIPVYRILRNNMHPARVDVFYGAVLAAATVFGALPYIVGRVIDIRFSDFRLVAQRKKPGAPGLKYGERVILGIAVNLLPGFCVQIWRIGLDFLPVPTFWIPILLTMPLTGYVLAGFPSRGYQLLVD